MDDDSNAIEQPHMTLNIGEHLQQARQSAGLSVEDVASELRIHINYVEHIESNQFDNLNGPTYVKGYLRNYARLLELDSEPLVASYQATLGEEPGGQTIYPKQRELLQRRGLLTGSAIVALALISVIAVWLFSSGYFSQIDQEETNTVATESADVVEKAESSPETELPVDQQNQTPASLAALVAGSADQAPTTPEVAKGQETTSTADSTQNSTQTDENTIILGEDDIITAPGDDFTDEIMITFTDECWVEIEDAGRNKLMNGLYQADDIKIILGNAPFQVFLGNASAVDIDFNGVKFDVAGNTRRNNTARFALLNQQ